MMTKCKHLYGIADKFYKRNVVKELEFHKEKWTKKMKKLKGQGELRLINHFQQWSSLKRVFKSEMKFKAGAIGDRRKTNRDHDKITAK